MENILHKRWLGLLLVAAMATPAMAQPVGRMRGFFGPAAVKVAATEEKADGDFTEAAGLKTDPEAQQLLTRAEQFITDERYDLAAVLMQKVLDDAGDNLVPVDESGRLYISLRRQVEQRLAELPKLALSTYRVTADGEAQALINGAKPDKEEEALSQVVRRYFMSSVGDDAAYKLGCMSLDRHDFIGASRMFSRILEEHPDPSMSQSDLLLRLSVAAARVGDRAGASKFLTEIENASGARPARALLSQVADDIEKSAGTTQLVSARLAMPALPADATSKTLTELWSREFPMTFQESATPNRGGMAYDQFGNPIVQQRAVSREQVISRWKQNGWMPAGKLQFGDGRVYFKTNEKVTAWSTEGKDKVVWESAWKNEYGLDDFSQYMAMMAMNGMQQGMGNDDRPRAPAEVLLFGDRVHQDFSIVGANLYSIEGRQISGGVNPPRAQKPFNWQTTPRRGRVNYLAAYDARTGKAKWHRAADDEVKEGTDGGLGFMAAPVACGTTLLVPVTDGGAMWLYGLSPEDGKTLWKTYLCDEPAGGCAPWSPVSIAVEGRDAYVLPGAGVVFAMDGTSGAIRWVVRYERQEKPGGGRLARNMYGQPNRLKEYNGWSEDKLIASGRQLVVMGSDSDQLFCLDCRTGDKLWDSPRTLPGGQEVDYCVGLEGRQLVVAGKGQVRGYDIVSGKIKWEYPPRNKGKEEQALESFGRGVLTDDTAYIPVKDSVLKLNPTTGAFLGQVGVRLSIPGEDPVGNLYSDGEKLWVLSANRVFALTHIEYRMQALEKRIKEGDAAALIDRFRLYSRDEAWDLAMSDLKAAYALLNTQKGPEEAVSSVFAAIDELKLASLRPTMTLETLTQLLGEANLKPEHRVKLDNVVSVAISSMPRTKTPGVATSLLSALPIMKQEFLLQSAARVVKRVATAEDKEALQVAASGTGPAALVAVEAWAMLDPEAAQPVLRKQVAGAEGKAKLLLVRSLLQTGDREGLETLIGMLESDDLQTRIQTFQALRGATGKVDLAFVSYAPAADRTKQVQAWKDWYAANKESVKLVLPLPESGTQLGRTLVASQSRNLIIELDAAGKEISRKQNIPQPWSVTGLPNGNRLVASTMNPFRVVEYDDQWKEVWVVDGLPAGTWSVDRAIDGATVIACADAGQVIEVKPGAAKEKRVLWSNTAGARPIFVKRLETGNTLICLQNMNKVIEIDGDGKQVWESPNFVNPFSAQRLENGNTLIAVMLNGANGSVVEVDRGGKTVKVHKQGLRQLYAAQKLESGNIMYIDNQGLHEIDPDGKAVFDRREQGVMFTGFSKF